VKKAKLRMEHRIDSRKDHPGRPPFLSYIPRALFHRKKSESSSKLPLPSAMGRGAPEAIATQSSSGLNPVMLRAFYGRRE
jgi:hypothetical protein